MNEEGLMRYVTAQKVANPWRGCSIIFEGLPSNARSTAHGARSAAATELRRSRCCDGAAQTSSVALILRVAYGADAAVTELMLRAALLRRSCDGAAQTSSVVLILRVASATELMLLRRS